MKRAARGQAVVETTLGLMVFVTVLLFGIHFSEVMVAQMKITEAAASSMWDTTAGPFHELPGDYSETGAAINRAQTQGQARYQGFDGRQVALGARFGTTFTQVATTMSNMQVRCTRGNGVDFFPGLAGRLYGAVYQDTGGVNCDASADIASYGAMRIGGFLDDANGFFQSNHRAGTALNSAGVKSCAVGRPAYLNGPCNHQFAMQLDDWGMSNHPGGPESQPCPVLPLGVPCLLNNPYWTSAALAYTVTSLPVQLNFADFNLVTAVYDLSIPPIWIPFASSPTSFYMSFTPGRMAGSNSLTPWATDPAGLSMLWQNTPFTWWPMYGMAFAASGEGYLGKTNVNSSSGITP